MFIGRICLNIPYMEVMKNFFTPIMVFRVSDMSSSNFNIPIFIVATERMGQIKWGTDSKVAPKHLIIQNKISSSKKFDLTRFDFII